jgi:hypothetical protein
MRLIRLPKVIAKNTPPKSPEGGLSNKSIPHISLSEGFRGCMQGIAIGSFVLFFAVSSTAQEQYFGRVLQENTNTGIVGATASLSKAGRTVLTDSLGWFNFGSGGIPVRATQQVNKTRSIELHSGNIRIETGANNEVASVYIYTLNGRIVWSVENVRLIQGINTIALNIVNAKTTQPLIVKVGLNNNIYTVRVMGLAGKAVLLNMQGNSTTGLKKQSAAMVDTLIVSKYGYFPVTQPNGSGVDCSPRNEIHTRWNIQYGCKNK